MASKNTLCKEIRWQLIENIDELSEIESQWINLHASSNGIVFNSPSWVKTWLDIFWQSQWQLKVIVAFHDDKLVAIAPLYINKNRGPFSVSRLMPLGQGEPESEEVMSEYQDIVLHNEYEKILISLQKHIQKIQFDAFEWRHVLENAVVLKMAKLFPSCDCKNNGLRYCNSKSTALTPKAMKKWQRCKNKLSNHNVEYTWERATPDLMKRMASFHQSRWNNKNELVAFLSPNFNVFHNEQCLIDIQKFSVMKVDGEIIAINYYLMSQGALHFYQAGWNQSFHYLAPGFCLHAWSILNSTESDYDLMISPKTDNYKQTLCGSIPVSSYRVIASNNRSLSHAKIILEKIVLKAVSAIKRVTQ